MSVRTTIDIPDDLHAALRQRAAAERTSIRSLITGALESTFRPQPSRRVTGPLVGVPAFGKPGKRDRLCFV
jgi:plasmid stability protein